MTDGGGADAGPVRSPLAGRLSPPEPWQRNAVFVFLGSTVVMGWIGSAIWATLVDRHPLWLLGLNATPKFLVLTTNSLDWWSYYGVGLVRNVITKPFMWLMGAWYGERAIAWAARQSDQAAQVIRWLQARFDRIGWLVVPFVSNNPVCLLAGSTGMPLLLFLGLAVAGTLTRLWLYRMFGATFSGPLDQFTNLVTTYRIPVAAASVVAVLGVLWWQHRRGRGGLGNLGQLDRDTEPPG